MRKLVTSYTFTAASKTVQSADFTSHEKIQLITNVTDSIIIYNFADATKGGTFSGSTLTLAYDTTSMSDTDKLQIFVDDGTVGDTLPSGAATAANQTTSNTNLGATNETAPASDTASSGLNGRLQRIAQRITSLIGLFPTALGSAAAASSFAVTQSTEDVARMGATNETAPASDTATSGLNGRLQRIAQRITSLIALLPTSLGQKTMANSLGVVIASDQSNLPVALAAGTNAIGKLAANSGVDIGDVDVTSVVPGTGATNAGKARDAVAGSTDTGSASLLIRRDSPTAVTPAAGDYEVPQMSANGEQYVAQVARTTGGYTPYKLVSAATTNATNVKASAGTVGYITVSSVNAAARYLKLYNKASSPTVGTDTPVHTFIIPGNTAGAGTNIPLPPQGINFSTGISFALTTEATDAGTTAVAANEIVVNIGYA